MADQSMAASPARCCTRLWLWRGRLPDTRRFLVPETCVAPFASWLAPVPAAEAGGRPAANAATQSNAKTSVNVDTVFSFTPRGGFSSVRAAAGAGTSANLGCAARRRPRGCLLRTATFGIRFLLGQAPTASEVI